AALETGFRRAGLPVSGGDGDEFHHVKRDVLVAAHDYVTGPVFLHKALASLYAGFERRRARIIAEGGASYLEPDVAHSAHDVVVITPAAFDAHQFHGVLRVLRPQHQVIAGNRDVADETAGLGMHRVDIRSKPAVPLQGIVVAVHPESHTR